MDLSERIAYLLAKHVTAIVVRQDDEPVDVCRFHRELADDIVDALSQLRGNVAGGRWRVPFCPRCGATGKHTEACAFYPDEPVETGNYEWVVDVGAVRAVRPWVHAPPVRDVGADRPDLTRGLAVRGPVLAVVRGVDGVLRLALERERAGGRTGAIALGVAGDEPDLA